MDARWLQIQFTLNPGHTKAGLAKALGLEAPAVSKILKGTRQIKAQEYAAMREYFGLPVDGADSIRKRQDAYVLSALTHQNLREENKQPNGEWVIPADILGQRTKAAMGQVKIFQVKENTMEPELHYGEHVLVDMSDFKPSPPGLFAVSDGFGHMIRYCEYIPQSSPPEIRVSARDKSFQPHNLKLDELQITGRIIAKLQWL
jgi:transcriptional regulator with XRE-family HTH domain